MRALIFHGPGDLRLEDVPDPSPRPATSSSRSRSRSPTAPTRRRSSAATRVLLGPPPSPFGHEFCGIDVATGRRVVAANSAPVRRLRACRRGQETLCENLLPLLNGAYAEFILVPERIARRNLLPVPPGLAPEVAAMVEPLACCLHGVDAAGIEPGDTVAILGARPDRADALRLRRRRRRPPVRRRRRARAARARAASSARCRRTPTGADVVIEAAGTVEAWERALALVRPGGTVLSFGGLPREARVPVDPYRIHYEELTLRGAFHHTPRHVRAALAFLASGAWPCERLITHRSGSTASPALLADPPRDYLKAASRPLTRRGALNHDVLAKRQLLLAPLADPIGRALERVARPPSPVRPSP